MKSSIKKSVFICQNCNFQSTKWVGKCSECGSWNTMIEEIKNSSSAISSNALRNSLPITLTDLSESSSISEPYRCMTYISEFDRVVGGGMVIGSVILFYGEPGIGKSTLLLQIANSCANNNTQCLYITGEESSMQIKLRAQRLNICHKDIKLLATNSMNEVIAATQMIEKHSLVVIDSIQTISLEEIDSAPGTISQTKSCVMELTRLAKNFSVIVLVIGHVTKDGQVAGPKLLEHMVDTVLSFEGDTTHQYRIIRAIKNRYGSTNEIAIFSMENTGLTEVNNPSKIFISGFEKETIGSCIFAGYEGSRSIMLEIQSLVVKSFLPSPKRSAVGWDNNRLSMIIAILISRLNLKISDKEIYINIAGGLRINEPAIDLAGAVAIISSAQRIPIPRDIVFFGEIGLLGELRQVVQIENRINEAKKLGFSRIVMPEENKINIKNIKDNKNNTNLDNKSNINLNNKICNEITIIKMQNIKDVVDFLIKS
ncbi:DNA repair protein RadA [Lyticum sinuosum]|uniref:DNA repair protein RadA n=1 Tax=Lyticum sinuosum TaxID=1332059 RepID=A0AAE5AHW3_9RICK|nr:DNA repair protein RadA [Lyticum sinuosum]MDZ5761254.1 DNA repair protein RadA [Lyticum sinuosum]